MELLYLLVSFTNQFISLIDGEYSGVDSLAHVNVGISQQCYELFTFVLHASKRNGDLIVVELLWEDDQQSGLNHAGQQLTLLWCRTAISVINMLQNKLEIDPLPVLTFWRPAHSQITMETTIRCRADLELRWNSKSCARDSAGRSSWEELFNCGSHIQLHSAPNSLGRHKNSEPHIWLRETKKA